MTEYLATNLARKKDKILRFLVFPGRLSVDRYPDGREVYRIDGTPLVEFLPVELHEERTPTEFILHATQSYRVLHPGKVRNP